MTVFVDPLFTAQSQNPEAFKVGERNDHRWCHMLCDGDLDELHAMAGAIGMKREWFQTPTKVPHYDLTPSRRAKALAAGAVEITTAEMVALAKRWRKGGDLHDRLPVPPPRAKAPNQTTLF